MRVACIALNPPLCASLLANKAALALPHPCWDGEEAQKVRGGTGCLQGHMVRMDKTVSGVRTLGGSPSTPTNKCYAQGIT